MQAFLAFMRTRSTTVAATQLGLSQSSVSRALGQLEAVLGLDLFQRRKGQLLPTPQAESLHGPIAALLDEWQLLQRRVAQLRAGERPRHTLRLTVPAALAARQVPQAVAALSRSHPFLQLAIQLGDDAAAEAALLADETDLAVLRLPAHDRRLQVQVLLPSAPVCVLPGHHPLAGRPVLALADLAGVGLILPPRAQRLRADLDLLFKAARITPRLCAESQCAQAAVAMAALGVGVAIGAGYLSDVTGDAALVQRPLAGATAFDVGLAWRAPAASAAGRADPAASQPTRAAALRLAVSAQLQAALLA